MSGWLIPIRSTKLFSINKKSCCFQILHQLHVGHFWSTELSKMLVSFDLLSIVHHFSLYKNSLLNIYLDDISQYIFIYATFLGSFFFPITYYTAKIQVMLQKK